MKKIITAFFVFLFFSSCAQYTLALDASRPNNIHGIHLAQPSDDDLKNAAKLVNSSGGDWGYVTLVIQENDRDKGKWQAIFNTLRELHLIPIIRLATNPEGSNWRRPNVEDAASWANFLDSLHWVVKERYVILFNETNHATEWGGAVDAASYAGIAKKFAEELKKRNKDYFIMLGGLDASAPQAGTAYQSEDVYLTEVVSYIGRESFNNLIDGLSSHSYPNPAFAGSPFSSGRGTVKTYEWELSLLKNIGINKELPVFITETGWSSAGVSRDVIGEYLKSVYSIWRDDSRIRAVTPFILNYQSEPFLGFSWQKQDSRDFYPQFEEVKSIPKTKGQPTQNERARFIIDFPHELAVQSEFHFKFRLQNTGQSIWSRDEDYRVGFASEAPGIYYFSDLKNVKPFEEAEVDLYLKTDNVKGLQNAPLQLFHGSEKIGREEVWEYEKIPWPSTTFNVNLYPKLKTDEDNFTFQLFDPNENLVFERNNIKAIEGIGLVENIRNVALGRRYRAVILKKNYLPRQNYMVFKRGTNNVTFPFMLPLDFNSDGKLDWSDIPALITNPSLFSLLFP